MSLHEQLERRSALAHRLQTEARIILRLRLRQNLKRVVEQHFSSPNQGLRVSRVFEPGQPNRSRLLFDAACLFGSAYRSEAIAKVSSDRSLREIVAVRDAL